MYKNVIAIRICIALHSTVNISQLNISMNSTASFGVDDETDASDNSNLSFMQKVCFAEYFFFTCIFIVIFEITVILNEIFNL